MVLVLLSLIEVSPIKINPWSRLAKIIGHALNAEVELLIVIVGMRIKKCKEIVIMISLAIILCSILMKFAQLKYQEKMS